MVDRATGGFSWGDFKDSGSTGSWAEAAESSPAPPADDEFPELDVSQNQKMAKKQTRASQKQTIQMEPELANLPRGSSGREHNDEREGGRGGYGDRDRDRNERYERRRREEEERPPSKADENRDWRKGPSGDSFGNQGGFQQRNNRNDFGGNNRNDFGSDFRSDNRPRRPRTVPGSLALERDYPTAPPFTGFISNIKFEATEDDMGNFLIDNKIDLSDLQWDMDDGKFRGSCTAIVSDLDSLKDLMSLDGTEFFGRSISVGLPMQQNDRRRNDMRRGPPGGGYQQPQERKKLDLKPRSADAPVQETRSSGIFGDAKPVDSASVYKRKQEEEEKEKAQKEAEEKKKAAEKKGGAGASVFGDAKPVDSTNVYTRKTPERPVEQAKPAEQAKPQQQRSTQWGPRSNNNAPSRSDGAWGRGNQRNNNLNNKNTTANKAAAPKKTEKAKAAPPPKDEGSKKPTNVFALLEEEEAE